MCLRTDAFRFIQACRLLERVLIVTSAPVLWKDLRNFYPGVNLQLSLRLLVLYSTSCLIIKSGSSVAYCNVSHAVAPEWAPYTGACGFTGHRHAEQYRWQQQITGWRGTAAWLGTILQELRQMPRLSSRNTQRQRRRRRPWLVRLVPERGRCIKFFSSTFAPESFTNPCLKAQFPTKPMFQAQRVPCTMHQCRLNRMCIIANLASGCSRAAKAHMVCDCHIE